MSEQLLIEEFAQTAVLVDNNPAEVHGLMGQLESSGILCKLYSPEDLGKAPSKVSPQIVFLDLILDTSRTEIENIALIRPMLRDKLVAGMGEPYGVVLWTQHPDKLDMFREKISLDRNAKAYNTPAFIVGLDKNKYLKAGYADCLSDLDNVLKSDKAACFFLKWMISVRKAAGMALSDIYSLVGDYEKQNTELLYLLSVLAKNHTGAPETKLTKRKKYNLTADAFKAFDELLYADLINAVHADGVTLFGSTLPTNPWKNDFQRELDAYSKLNTKTFIDTINIAQSIIVPGNVYDIPRKKIPKACKVPEQTRTVMIELTPPCDFSHKKVCSRFICGFMMKCGENAKTIKSDLNDLQGDNRYLLWPMSFEKANYILCFDFRCIMTPSERNIITGKYKVLFKVKPRLFADILQKFSSHAARLGIPDMKPNLKKGSQ